MMPSLSGSWAGGREQRTLLLGCLCLAGLAAYANSLSGPMVLDDQASILFNPQIRHLWPPFDALAPPRDTALANRPVANLSFAVNYALGGLSVRGYHLVNVGFHMLSALSLFGVIRLTLSGPRLRDRFAGTADEVAMACALIWMVHPIQTEAVDYLTERTELMMGFFYLLTLYCAIRAVRSPAPDRWHMAAIVACLLGAGSKESIVTAPVIVVLYDRIFVFDSLKDALRTRKTLYLGLALSWIEVAALATSRNHTAGFSAGTSAWMYLLNQAQMISRYLRLTIWPDALVLDYGAPRMYGLRDVLPQAALVIALLMLTGIMLVRSPMAGFLGAWFFITLAPTSSFIPIVSEVGAERRMYLPLAGLVVAAVIGVYRWSRAKKIAPYFFAGLVVALAVGTAQRNRDYASKVTLLQTSVDRWPHGRAHYNLALALKALGRKDETVAQLRAAVAEIPQAQLALGSELYDGGQFDAAIAALQTYVSLTDMSPVNVVTARNLEALALVQRGKLVPAAEALQLALQIDPANPGLHVNLASVLLRQKNFEGARRHYEESLKIQPGTAFVLTNLAVALEGLGDRDGARARFREALALDPSDANARAGLSRVNDAR
jgi:Flp pilus assembly protein TadD